MVAAAVIVKVAMRLTSKESSEELEWLQRVSAQRKSSCGRCGDQLVQILTLVAAPASFANELAYLTQS